LKKSRGKFINKFESIFMPIKPNALKHNWNVKRET